MCTVTSDESYEDDSVFDYNDVEVNFNNNDYFYSESQPTQSKPFINLAMHEPLSTTKTCIKKPPPEPPPPYIYNNNSYVSEDNSSEHTIELTHQALPTPVDSYIPPPPTS